jgi:hypothetical protein
MNGTDGLYYRWNSNGATYFVLGLRTNTVAITKVATLPVPPRSNQDGTTCLATTTPGPDDAPHLSVGGNFSAPLGPGGSAYINLTLTNSYATPVVLPSHALRITLTSSSASCPVATNFDVRHGVIVDVTVPANTTTTLSALGVPMVDWPRVNMLDLPTNQDACRGVSLSIAYSWWYTG